MKGMVYRLEVCDSVTDWSHGFMYPIHRLVLPEARNLAINLVEAFYGGLAVIPECDIDASYEFVQEIEVPDELVTHARTYLNMRQSLTEEFTRIIPPLGKESDPLEA